MSDENVTKYRDMFEARISARVKDKLPTNASGRVLWHGRSRQEICGKILRTCEQNDSTIVQSRNVMHGWPSMSRRRKWKWELYTVCPQIVLKCLYLILWPVNKLAKTLLLQGHLGDSKSTSGGVLCILGSHTFVLISWMCKKQTSVSQRHSNKHGSHAIRYNEFCYRCYVVYLWGKWGGKSKWWSKNEVPIMRHVSRIYRVALDLLLDRINLDPKIQNPLNWHQTPTRRHVDWRKFHTTRDEWKKFFICSTSVMWWRCPHILLREVPPPHRVRLHLKVRGVPIASEKPDSRMNIEPSSFDAAVNVSSATQRCTPWRVRGRAAEKHVASRRRRRFRRIRQSWGWGCESKKENLSSETIKLRRNPLHTEVSSSVDKESQKNTEATLDHHIHISPDTSPYMEAVFSMVRKINGKQPDDPMVK